MKHDMPWGSSPAIGHYTYWPADDAWEFSEGMYAIFAIAPDTPITTALVMSHQHPDDADRTLAILRSDGHDGGAACSYQHRVVDGRGFVHEVLAVGSYVHDELGARTEGFLVDLSEAGGHPEQRDRMVPVEFDPVDLVITPCRHCAQWWAEVASTAGRPVVREWHEPFCPEALRWEMPDAPLLARGPR